MLALLGLCKGHYSDSREMSRADGTKYTITEHSVLLQVEQPNKFGIVESKVVQVRLSKSHVEKGMDKSWNQLKDSQVSIPVYVQPWSSKVGNAGFDYWLSGDGIPLNLQRVPAKPQVVANG